MGSAIPPANALQDRIGGELFRPQLIERARTEDEEDGAPLRIGFHIGVGVPEIFATFSSLLHSTAYRLSLERLGRSSTSSSLSSLTHRSAFTGHTIYFYCVFFPIFVQSGISEKEISLEPQNRVKRIWILWSSSGQFLPRGKFSSRAKRKMKSQEFKIVLSINVECITFFLDFGERTIVLQSQNGHVRQWP